MSKICKSNYDIFYKDFLKSIFIFIFISMGSIPCLNLTYIDQTNVLDIFNNIDGRIRIDFKILKIVAFCQKFQKIQIIKKKYKIVKKGFYLKTKFSEIFFFKFKRN